MTKISANGQSLVYSTYLGGGEEDHGNAIATDPVGNAYITGDTRSDDFPTKNALYPTRRGLTDVFVTKINPIGELIYSTYFGGLSNRGYGIAADADGNAYITGYTLGFGFPLKNPLFEWQGSDDAFVAKFDPQGSLIFSTYFGGTEADYGRAIAIDGVGTYMLPARRGPPISL